MPRLAPFRRLTLALFAAAGLLLAAGWPAAPAAAQQVPDLIRSRYSPAAYYNYGEEGDVTIEVYVWGNVANPGLYEVPRDTNLGKLFSLAGGPAVGERSRNQRIRLEVRLMREASPDDRPAGARTVVYERVFEDDESFVIEDDIALQAGDVLVSEQYVRDRFTWRDALPIVSAVTSVASTIIAVVAISRR
jgi:purine nucleoside permease